MNRYLTSAERAVIARITDLAIDVTAEGKYLASASFNASTNSIDLRVERRRPETDIEVICSTFTATRQLPNGPQLDIANREPMMTLARMAEFLESLLETPEAPTC